MLMEKQFQLMCYPNRTHSINEGPGTKNHLINLYTDFLKLHFENVMNYSSTANIESEFDGIAEGKRILIIDDMVRSGGTLAECAKALKKAGSISVSAFAGKAACSFINS